MSYQFPVTRTNNPKPKPDQSNLGFGKYFTDHMFIMDYDEGQGWHDGKIVPYGPISLDPASCVLHYAQMMFEGMKAYLTPEGKINLFRPDMNAKRLNRTNERMCIPFMDEELFVEAVKATVRTDADWIPTAPGTALYIRPYIISDEVSFSVEPAKHYHFIIILCAVGAYYDINRGGLTGSHIYVEEVGTSNAFFMIGDEVITAPLGGSILPGVTRDSTITLLRKWGYKVSERRLSIQEIEAASKDGSLQEAWATGTACVISPIGYLRYMDRDIVIHDGGVGPVSQKLYDHIYGMQTGVVADDMGWIVQL
jgi:branched-chain amino acid aminotransferase